MGGRYGRYEVVCKLGEGAMAAVHLARDPVLARFVAVKVLHRGVAAGKTALQRFFNEAKVVAKVRNPHVVEVFDFGREGGEYFLVMEFVDGRSLQGLLRQVPPGETLDEVITACLMVQAAEGLEMASRHGVVHRDIKPENLMLNSQGYLKIADFGIAHLQDETLTRTGAVLGSPLYMSPEQVRGAKPITSQSDMFSLGAVIYRCLAGFPPFEAPSLKELYRKIAQEPHVPLLEARPGMDPSLAALAETLLAKDPARRGQGPRWLRAELRAFILSRGVDDPMERIGDRLREMSRDGVPAAGPAEREAAALPRTVASSRPMLVEESAPADYSAGRTLPRTRAALQATGMRFPWIAAAVISLILLAAAAVHYALQASQAARAGADGPAAAVQAIRPSLPAPASGAAGSVARTEGSAPVGAMDALDAGDAMAVEAREDPGREASAADSASVPPPAGPGPVQPDSPAGTGSLLVRSSPPFAEVFLDGRSRGVTPVSLSGLSVGPHRLLVRGATGIPVDTLLRLGPGKRTVRVRLDPGAVAMEDVEE